MNTEPKTPPNVNPADVATYLHVKINRTGTMREIATAKSVSDAMQADPAVREFVEQLERLEEPTLHPERFPSNN